MPGSRLALIVATDEYADSSLRALSSPASDADALAEVLGDPELGEFDVEVLHNRESREIELRLETVLTDRRPQDVVLIHFSCHGLKDDSGQLYLAARDTLPTLLWSTAVDATLVNRLIRKSRAGQVVLLLDCCYGGAFERGMVARAAGDVDVGMQFEQQEELVAGRGRAVITASSAMEYAFEGSQLTDTATNPPSVFTSALTEGLRTGSADRGQDGMVDLSELYDYVYDRVRETNPRQTPCKWEYGTQGDLVIARNPNRRIALAPLPDSLQALVTHPFAATRGGAVQELRALAAGTNLPLAATARAELVRLQSDDSRSVSTAAAEAVRDTEVGVTEEQVDLGAVDRGAVVTRVVELAGVPLVDASRARPQGEGITVRKSGRRVTIELDTAIPRTVEAAVLVEGPAGSRTIGVSAEVRGTMPEPATPEPVTPDPVVPEPVTPTPVSSEADTRRRARVAAALVLAGTLGSAATLGPDWTTGTDPAGPPGTDLATWGGASYLLPLVVLVVGAAMLWSQGSTPVAAGLVAGTATSMLVVLAQNFIRLFADPSRGLTPTTIFWLAVGFRLLVAVGALVALSGLATTEGRSRVGGGAPRLLAAAVVLAATVGGFLLSWPVGVIPIARGQLAVFLAVGLVAGVAATLLVHPRSRRQTLLSAITALCVLVLLSDINVWIGFYQFSGNSAMWHLINAGAAALVLLAAWAVTGDTASRRAAVDD